MSNFKIKMKIKKKNIKKKLKYCIMLVAWDTKDGDEILTSLYFP